MAEREGPAADRAGFAAFAADLDYPMYVVTAADGDERSGCLAGFVTQCSIDPPRLLVCVSVVNHTHPVAERVAAAGGMLGVHLLDRGQRELAELFGGETGDEVDKFAHCAWRADVSGVPVLTDAPRSMVGRVLDRMPAGDHTAYLVEPTRAAGRDADVLMFADVRHLHPGHPA